MAEDSTLKELSTDHDREKRRQENSLVENYNHIVTSIAHAGDTWTHRQYLDDLKSLTQANPQEPILERHVSAIERAAQSQLRPDGTIRSPWRPFNSAYDIEALRYPAALLYSSQTREKILSNSYEDAARAIAAGFKDGEDLDDLISRIRKGDSEVITTIRKKFACFLPDDLNDLGTKLGEVLRLAQDLAYEQCTDSRDLARHEPLDQYEEPVVDSVRNKFKWKRGQVVLFGFDQYCEPKVLVF